MRSLVRDAAAALAIATALAGLPDLACVGTVEPSGADDNPCHDGFGPPTDCAHHPGLQCFDEGPTCTSYRCTQDGGLEVSSDAACACGEGVAPVGGNCPSGFCFRCLTREGCSSQVICRMTDDLTSYPHCTNVCVDDAGAEAGGDAPGVDDGAPESDAPDGG